MDQTGGEWAWAMLERLQERNMKRWRRFLWHALREMRIRAIGVQWNAVGSFSEVREAPKAFGGFGQEEEVHQAAAERAACSVQPMMEHLMKKESLPMNGGANEQCS